jgi:hypothetical protein
MTTRRTLTLDSIPQFATDEQIGEVFLGHDRRREFADLAAVHEPRGMPRVDAFWGGRYVPAVRAYLDKLHNLRDVVPMTPDGVEGKFDVSRRSTSRARG